MAERDMEIRESKRERAKKMFDLAFAKNAVILFGKATEMLCKRSEFLMIDYGTAHKILDQILHSILFSGHVQVPRYSPVLIVPDKEILNVLEEDFPGAFCDYQTHVARRTPFSYFLELVTLCYGQENEVKRILSEFLNDCQLSGELYPLISKVICICETDNHRYYGVSLSCEDKIRREIMTAVSCVSKVWHLKVSSAVMSVFPEDTGNPRRITLPSTVRCRAYALKDLSQVKPPCERCHELYSLPNPSGPKYSPGNCAETEAISNLLHDQKGVNDNTTITVGVYDEQEIQEKMTACFNKNKTKRKENPITYDIQTVYGV